MRKPSPDTRVYAVVVIGAALLVAGCGSSAQKTATTGNANQAASGGTVSPAANSASTAATGAALTLGASPYGKVIFDAQRRAVLVCCGSQREQHRLRRLRLSVATPADQRRAASPSRSGRGADRDDQA